MKISIIITNLDGGGAERVNISLAKEFAALGFEVEFVLSELRGVLIDEVRDFNIVELNNSSKLSLIRSMSNYFNDKKPDYVIVSMWGLTAYAPIARLLSCHKPKLMLVEHNSLVNQFKNSRFTLKFFLKVSTVVSYRLADHLAGVSRGVVKDMKLLSGIRGDDKISALYNPIELKTFFNSVAIDFWNDCSYKILNVGSYKEQKNQLLLIEAFSKLSALSEAKLIILGSGEMRNKLESKVEEYGLQNRVLLHDFVNEPQPFYIQADLFVLSSDREGFGNVIVEAMGYGTPVVSTDCEHGPREILDNGKYGSLVPVGDAEALAKAMDNALKVEHNEEKLIERAKDFSPAISARRYLEVMGVYADERK